MIPSYTCLDQSSPEPAAGLLKLDLDDQLIAHRLNSIINQQHAFQWSSINNTHSNGQSYTKQTSYN